MIEKDLWLKLGLIVLIVGLSVTFIWPPEDKLKRGIDLGGGHSLLFEIDDTGEADRGDLAQRVMDILKQRVDPGGQRNLIWRPIGRNRLEIQMPQPPANQREAREAYEKAREAIADTQVTRTQILNALQMPADQRQGAINRMVGAVASRKPLLDTLVQTVDRYRELSGPATTQPTTQTIDPAKAQEMDRLFDTRNQTIEKILATNLDPQVLSDLLDLDPKSEVRGTRIEELKKNHPDLKSQVEEMIKRYQAWSKQKGYLDDPSDLMRLLRGAGKLEFRILAQRDPSTGRIMSSKPEYQEQAEKYIEQLGKYGPRRREGDNFAWFQVAKPEENSITQPNSPYIVGDYLGAKYVLSHATEDMGLLNDGTNSWKLRQATVGRDRAGQFAVNFTLDARGGDKFAVLTGNNIERPLCIFLDNKAISAATIRSQINTDGQISGRFTQQEVAYLVNTLEAGVLPARLKEVPLQEKSVGPGLGQTNRTKGITATALALLVTLVFMAIYYSYSGFIANIALMMNFVITLGVMSFLGNTFTLPGIAGLILTLGMAVDANVLIYERIREELQRGVSARMAVRLGYEKAFSAILDSNVTTIITAVILGYLGSEEIKGFGQTLGIGLCCSMFTALFVTRQYFNVMLPSTLDKQETKKVWGGTAVMALLGGAIFGLGWMLNKTPELREESALVGLGTFLLVMFATALLLVASLWTFRAIYHATGHARANRMPMLKLISMPSIDWMSKRHIFWGCSAVVVLGGMFFAWEKLEFDTSTVLDIEFIGGTSVQVELKPDQKMTDEQLADHIVGKDFNDKTKAVGWLRNAAGQLEAAQVSSIDENRYLIKTTDKFTTVQMEALLLPKLGDKLVRGGIRPAESGFEVEVNSEKIKKVDEVQASLKASADYARAAADRLRTLRVQLVEEQTAQGTTRKAFEIITTETSRRLVAEALLVPMRDVIEATQPIEARLVTVTDKASEGYFPIKQADNTVADVLGAPMAGNAAQEAISEYKGGVLLVFGNITPTATTGEIVQRIKDMRLQPDFEAAMRDFKVIGIDADPNSPAGEGRRYSRMAVVVVDPAIPYVEEGKNDSWQAQVAEKEKAIAQAAFASSRSLQRVTQFAPQVAGEAAMKAIIAIIISLIAIAVYMWARFGSAEFGLCGIIALYHDVAVALTAVVLSHVLYDTPIGHLLGMRDFRIDLSIIAALLTIVGFSINDTIVIFDRIRENRGRMATVSHELVNRSLNETMSRTIITTFTVLLTVLVMYIWGGEGIKGFAFCMLVGCISGTYSTIAIATPLVNAPRAMWLTTIILSALTLLGLVFTVQSKAIEIILIVMILGVSAYGIYRIMGISQGARQQAQPPQPTPA